MLAPLRAQSPAYCRTLAWLRLHPLTPRRPPARGSAGPCLAQTSSVDAALAGAPRALVCGQLWRRGGATVEVAYSAVALGTRSSASRPCSVAPASAYPPAPTPWSCPASPIAPPAPQLSLVWHLPPLCLCPPSHHCSPSTSHMNRYASQSLVNPLLPARRTPPRS